MIYLPKRKPRAHQVDALAAIRNKSAFAILAAMRTGKTFIVVNDWGEMVHDGKVYDLVVVAPGGCYLTWDDALKLDLPDEIAQKLRTFVWVSQTAKNKSAAKEREWFLNQRGPRALIINVEALSAVLSARQFVYNFVKQRPQACMGVL